MYAPYPTSMSPPRGRERPFPMSIEQAASPELATRTHMSKSKKESAIPIQPPTIEPMLSTAITFATFDPSMLPIATPCTPRNDAVIVTASSGKEVPNATMLKVLKVSKKEWHQMLLTR